MLLGWRAPRSQASTGAQVWEDNYDGSELLSSANLKGSKEPLAQGRCSGFGGGFKAVKVSSGGFAGEGSEEHQALPQAERKEMTLSSLQGTLLAYPAYPFADCPHKTELPSGKELPYQGAPQAVPVLEVSLVVLCQIMARCARIPSGLALQDWHMCISVGHPCG